MPREGTKTLTFVSLRITNVLRLDMPREGTKTDFPITVLLAYSSLRLDMPREGTKTQLYSFIKPIVVLRLDMPREGTKTKSTTV